MKKLFTLLTLALMSIGSAWAGEETPGKTGTSNAALIGTSYTIAGTYVAGAGGVQVTPMESKGVKVRLNQNSNKLVISPNAGYEINAFTIYAVTNDNTATNSVTSIKVGETEKLAASIEIPNKQASTAATIALSGIDTQQDITLSFGSGASQGVFDFHFTYTQKEVITQEITAVSLNGSAISSSDLATLKSTKALTINGSSLNGLGALDVTLSSGATTVTRTIDGTSAIYTFTINTSDEYTITVTNVAKTYTKTGVVLAYSEDGTEATGTNSNTVTINGITAAMVDAAKTFQYGTGNVTLGSTKYVPLKLSTGSAVNVTFPTGVVATKVKVYGWSVNGNGKLNAMKETSDGAKSVDVSADVYYATNTAGDIYPSVYEYNLDNWTSLWFNPGGSPSQPFVVMEFTLEDNATATIGSTGWATFVCNAPLDFTSVTGLKAYIVTGNSGSAITTTQMTGTVPANTPLLLEGATTAIPVAASSSTDVSANLLKAGTGAEVTKEDGKTKYVLSADGSTAVFKKINATAATVAAGKAYLEFSGDVPAPMLSMGGETTGINAVNGEGFTVNGEYFNLAGQRVAQPTKGLYIVNGRKVVIK